MAKKNFKNKVSATLNRPDNAPSSLTDFQNGGDGPAEDKRGFKNKTIVTQDDNKKRYNVKTAKRQNAIMLNNRITVYLSDDAINKLDALWLRARKSAPTSVRKSISKSLILETAFHIASENDPDLLNAVISLVDRN